MSNAQPLPATYEFALYRGDTRVWTHQFNDQPVDWATATVYVVGVVGASTYTPLTTVTFDGVTYTCTTAHTSGADFEAANWTVDPAALGLPTDLTDWVFIGQYRASTAPDATLIAEDLCEVLAPATDGLMRRTLTHIEAAKLNVTPVYWDLQATEADGETVKTFLKKDKLKVSGDVSRDVAP